MRTCTVLSIFYLPILEFLSSPFPHTHTPLPRPPQSRKKPVRRQNILGNLLLQLLRPGKFLLRAKPLPEPHLNPFRREVTRIIQKVCLHTQSRSIESGPHSNIRYTPVTTGLPLQHRPRNINASRRQ